MRRNVKVKSVSTRVPLRKAATSANAAARRPFPAWIDAADGAAFSATTVTPRLRSALVLRTVSKKKSVNPRSAAHGPGAE
jgi:hypothetical protein